MPVSYVFTSANGSTTYDNQALPPGSAMVDANGNGLLNLVVTISGNSYTNFLSESLRTAAGWGHINIQKNGNRNIKLHLPQETDLRNQRADLMINNINNAHEFSDIMSYNEAQGTATLTLNRFVFTNYTDSNNTLSDTSDIESLRIEQVSELPKGYLDLGVVATFQSVHATPMYLGPMLVSQTAINFTASTLINAKAPSASTHLVPKAYVDKYISDTSHYFQDLIAKTNGRDMMDRISSLELQLERLYQALFKISRDAAVIVTSDGNGGLANLTYNFASDVQAPTDLAITVPPSAPVPAAITF